MKTIKHQLFLIIVIIMGLGNLNCSKRKPLPIPHITKYYVIVKIINNSSQDVELIDSYSGIKHNLKIGSGKSISIENFGDDDMTKEAPFKSMFGNSVQLIFKNGKKIKYYCRRNTDTKCNEENNPLSAKNYTSEFLGEEKWGDISRFKYQLTYNITEDQLLKAK